MNLSKSERIGSSRRSRVRIGTLTGTLAALSLGVGAGVQAAPPSLQPEVYQADSPYDRIPSPYPEMLMAPSLDGGHIGSQPMGAGHASDDPLWSGYRPDGGNRSSCDCADCRPKRSAPIRKVFDTITAGLDTLMFGNSARRGSHCDASPDCDAACDAMGPIFPMQRAVGPAPQMKVRPPRLDPPADQQLDPFADDPIYRSSNPAVQRSGYFD